MALLSVTEGDDKPLKYPLMFRNADVVLITKVDLLPHLPVDVAAIRRNIHSINPNATVIEVSALRRPGCLAHLGAASPRQPDHHNPCSGHRLSRSIQRLVPPAHAMTKQLRNLLFAGLAIVLAVACSKPSTPTVGGTPIVLGYSNWAGLPWRKSCSRRTA